MTDDKLKKRIAMLEVEQERQQDEVNLIDEFIKSPTEAKEFSKPRPKAGFVVSLNFGEDVPISEWSDETQGWRTEGLGTRYGLRHQAEKRVTELQKRWPDYPFEIHLRES